MQIIVASVTTMATAVDVEGTVRGAVESRGLWVSSVSVTSTRTMYGYIVMTLTYFDYPTLH